MKAASKSMRSIWASVPNAWQAGNNFPRPYASAIRSVGTCAIVWFAMIGCESQYVELPTRESMEPIREDVGIVGRTLLKCPTGDCIVLHFPPCSVEENDRELGASPWEVVTKQVLQTDDADPENDGFIVELPERWGGPTPSELTLSTFNCCAYAVGDVLKLGHADWIDTRRRHQGDPDAPIQIVLASYFKEVDRLEAKSTDLNQLSNSKTLQDGDLICFGLTFGKQFDCIHIGKVKKINDRWWLESKLGPGPVVVATISGTATAYAGEYDVVLIFRPRR